MDKDKLKTAVLGLNHEGLLLLEAALQTELFQIQAVADKDSAVAETTGKKYDCAHYDDYRRLLTTTELDCLIVAAGLYSCHEQLRMAMKKKLHILKAAPAGRNFEEAAEYVNTAQQENVRFAIACAKRFGQSYNVFRDFLREAMDEQSGVLTSICNYGDCARPAWHSDPKLAGGGVLLRDCYEIIDQIVYNFWLPQQVYTANNSMAEDKKHRQYLTEDTAIVTMKFSDTLVGNMVVSRVFGPRQEFLRLCGKNRILTVTDNKVLISTANSGRIIKRRLFNDNRLRWCREMVTNFALSILQPDKNELCNSAKDNLLNMAVIEAAYLSARTGMPEQPSRILEMALGSAGKKTASER